MIYLKMSNGIHVLILEPANIDRLKAGSPAKSPDGEVLVTYTPDAVWLGKEMNAVAGFMTPEMLDMLLQQSRGRPEVNGTEFIAPRQIIKDGKLTGQ